MLRPRWSFDPAARPHLQELAEECTHLRNSLAATSADEKTGLRANDRRQRRASANTEATIPFYEYAHMLTVARETRGPFSQSTENSGGYAERLSSFTYLGTQGKFQLLPSEPPYYPSPRGKSHTRGNIWSLTVG